MVLTPELIEHAKKEVDITQYFQPSEVCTPKHELFKQFIEGTKWKGLPKIIFYILMDDLFPSSIKKAPCGDLGYSLQLKPQ
jgi:hypothetical protein